MSRWWLPALFLLIFLAGCNIPLYGSYYQERATRIGYLLNPLGDGAYLIQVNASLNETVYVFACQKPQLSGWAQLLSLFFDPGFVGTECGIYNMSQVEDELEQAELVPRATDIGFGPTIMDFQEAIRYCNNSPRYAISFIYGTDYSFIEPTSLITLSQTCLAQHAVMPVYVFSTPDGRPPAVPNEKDIGKLLSYNPSMVVYLHNTNNTTASLDWDRIKQGIKDIKASCPRCLVGLGLSFTDEVVPTLASQDEELLSLIDFTAFGVDAERANTYRGQALYGKTLYYFGYLKALLGKPVLIYYTDLEGMTDYEARVFYSLMFNSLRQQGPLGLLGYTAEPFYEEKSPALKSGLVRDGQANQKKFSMVFSQCQLYYGRKPTLAYFSKTGNAALPYAFSTRPFYTFNAGQATEVAEPPYILGLSDRDELLYDCSPCFEGETAEALKDMGVQPLHIPPYDCERLKGEAAYYAGLLYFDPAAIMALATLSAPDPCHSAFVPPYEMDECAYPSLPSDIESCNVPTYRLDAGGECSPSDTGPLCYVCRYGPLEVPYPPANLNPPSDVLFFCGEDFDPYNEEDAYCGAAVALAKAYDEVEGWIEGHEDEFFIEEGEKGPTLLVLTALHYFYGRETASSFAKLARDVGDATSCSSLSGDAFEFCCSYDEQEDDYVLTNPLCGQELSPAELFVKIHNSYTPPGYVPVWQRWKFETEKAYDYLEGYVGVVGSCEVCDRALARQNLCKTLERVYGYDVCSQVDSGG